MDIGYLTKYAVPLIVGICLCVGYIIKNMIPSDKINRFIPLIMGILGVVLNVWVNMDFTAEILLAGLFSGLSSTGLYELFRNLIGGSTNGVQRYK
ncbi:MAG: phage holin family protein [Christensenellales bacterium]